MKKKLSEFAKASRRVKNSQNYVDPTAGITARCDLMAAGFQSPKFRDPRSREFLLSKNAAQHLLVKAMVANHPSIWDDLDYPSGIPQVPEPTVCGRDERLRDALAQLKREDSGHGDFRAAMDLLDDVVGSMRIQFRCGRFSGPSDECPVERRYVCAAMLAAMGDGIARVWWPVRRAVEQKLGVKPFRLASR